MYKDIFKFIFSLLFLNKFFFSLKIGPWISLNPYDFWWHFGSI